MQSPYTVLVTGGAGFLGQHVVGLLQTKADHVTEIRVIDVVPYVNKLDYAAPKPVRQYVGSITDLDLLLEACQGVHCVMHIASVVDVTMFPDENISYKVNVTGTEKLIKACRQRGVASLVYCSTEDVVIGHDNIYQGTEVSTNKAHKNLFQIYGPTKTKAEEIVLKANDDNLRTVSLRPVAIYGELDQRYMTHVAKQAMALGGSYFRINCGNAVADMCYAGNIAWAFLCAERALIKNGGKTSNVAGHAFFIGDESPKKNIFDFFEPMFNECGLKPIPFKIPPWLVLYPFYLLYFILLLISFVKRVNFFVGIAAVLFLTKTYTFSYEKARRELQYEPLFSYEEAHRRSVKFLANFCSKNGGKYKEVVQPQST